MSWKGLTKKGVEILTPDEWNTVIDALDELNARTPKARNGGKYSFTGDGVTATFKIAHGLSAAPTAFFVMKGSPNAPDIDYVDADSTYIYVYFKAPPASGSIVYVWWYAFIL